MKKYEIWEKEARVGKDGWLLWKNIVILIEEKSMGI